MLRTISTDRIYGNPNQPRQIFDEKGLRELADSIEMNGLLQPIKVRPDSAGKFMIVCGERRWRAHQLAGIKTIKADVVDADQLDDQALAIAAIVENLQRTDITPLEEAKAFQRMLDTGMTVNELSKRLGLKQSWRITERTSLLKIRPEYQVLLAKSIITPSQAFEMSRLNPANQDQLLALIKAGKCDTYNRLRATASALLETEQQSEMFDPPKPVTEEERRRMDHLESTPNHGNAREVHPEQRSVHNEENQSAAGNGHSRPNCSHAEGLGEAGECSTESGGTESARLNLKTTQTRFGGFLLKPKRSSAPVSSGTPPSRLPSAQD